jgi:hypothetical protein
MGLLLKRESDRIGADLSKVEIALSRGSAAMTEAEAAKSAAESAGDLEAHAEACQRLAAAKAFLEVQRARGAQLGRDHAEAVKRELEADDDRFCDGLNKREARQAETFERDFAKAVAPLIAFLTARAGDAAEAAEANKRRAARGLPPILTADERARSIAGRIEPAAHEDCVVWRKYEGGPEVTVFGRSKTGEMVPAEAGAVRVVERRCVRAERHIAPTRAKPLIEAVVIPGFAAGGAPLWPAKGAR